MVAARKTERFSSAGGFALTHTRTRGSNGFVHEVRRANGVTADPLSSLMLLRWHAAGRSGRACPRRSAAKRTGQIPARPNVVPASGLDRTTACRTRCHGNRPVTHRTSLTPRRARPIACDSAARPGPQPRARKGPVCPGPRSPHRLREPPRRRRGVRERANSSDPAPRGRPRAKCGVRPVADYRCRELARATDSVTEVHCPPGLKSRLHTGHKTQIPELTTEN